MGGSLTVQLGNLTSLASLNLSANQFSGTIPELENLQSLTALDLGYNRFSGGMPKFWRLKSLCRLDFSRNSLESSLPTELGLLCPGIREYPVTATGNSSITIPIRFSFGFDRFWGSVMPTEREVENVREKSESFVSTLFETDFPGLQSLNLTLLDSLFDIDDTLPVSLVFQMELTFIPGKQRTVLFLRAGVCSVFCLVF